MNKKKDGFIFISVLLLMILVTSVSMSVAVLNRTHAEEVIEDTKKDKLYYIANAGLEMVYGALNNTQQSDGAEASNIMQDMKILVTKPGYVHNSKTYKLRDGQDIEIKVDNVIVGYAHVEGNLYEIPVKNSEGKITHKVYYYKILSKGRLNELENNPQNIFTMSMIIPLEYPNDPKIYTGDKALPKN